MDQALQSLRKEFPHTRRAVFFDHANFGPSPKRARRLVDQLGARFQALDPLIDRESFALLAKIKKDFGRIIGAHGDDISYLPNTTFGINHILLGLKLRPGERIMLPENEFPALAYPILYLVKKRRLKVQLLPCPHGYLELDDLDCALGKHKTALFATSWVQYHNGYRYDAAALADVCHRHGTFFLLDGTQGIGAVPLNAGKAGVDALACGGQKWLFCQTGSGFLYLSPHPIRKVEPMAIGWLAADWNITFNDLQRHDRPIFSDGRRFEWGTYPYYSLRLAQVGLELIRAAGPRRTFRHVTRLLDHLVEFLREGPYTIVSDLRSKCRSTIFAFTGPKIERLHRHLADRKVRVSLREGNIRVSPHFYNTPQEMRRCISVIGEYPADRKSR